jgi:hypothetical protein
MFGLERNQQASDPTERTTTTLRCLKDRYTGRATGNVTYLRYDQDTAQLNEVNISEEEKVKVFHDDAEEEGSPVPATAEQSDF